MVSLVSIICGLIFILSYPDGEDALNVEIGDLMKKDYQLYKKIVLHTIEGRIHKNQLYDNVKINKNWRISHIKLVLTKYYYVNRIYNYLVID